MHDVGCNMQSHAQYCVALHRQQNVDHGQLSGVYYKVITTLFIWNKIIKTMVIRFYFVLHKCKFSFRATYVFSYLPHL